MKILLVLFLSLFAFAPATFATKAINDNKQFAYNRDVKLGSVVDGDTIYFLIKGVEQKVRLLLIDSPESDQPGGDEATRFTSRLLKKNLWMGVDLMCKGRQRLVLNVDVAPRLQCSVFVGGVDVGLALVKAGHAVIVPWMVQKKAYKNAERDARRKKKGFWGQNCKIMPHQWREGVRTCGGTDTADTRSKKLFVGIITSVSKGHLVKVKIKSGEMLMVNTIAYQSPHRDQPGHEQAVQKMEQLVLGKSVLVKGCCYRSGALMGEISVNGGNGLDVQKEMVSSGNGITNKWYGYRKPLLKEEAYAKNKRIGVWKNNCVILPRFWLEGERDCSWTRRGFQK